VTVVVPVSARVPEPVPVLARARAPVPVLVPVRHKRLATVTLLTLR
jgi:hypothetical protein